MRTEGNAFWLDELRTAKTSVLKTRHALETRRWTSGNIWRRFQTSREGARDELARDLANEDIPRVGEIHDAVCVDGNAPGGVTSR